MGEVRLLKGTDMVLLSSAVTELVHRLVGDGDRSLMVEELAGDEWSIGMLLDAASTPPFFTDSRIVVGWGIQRFEADELAAITVWLADPLPTTHLVLTASGGRLPKALLDAVKRTGQVVDAGTPGSVGDRRAWVSDHIAESGLRLDPAARTAVADTLGEDVGRLASVLDTLVATFGPGARLSAVDVAPFLGDAGAVPPWELTDAIDKGDTRAALDRLDRLVRGGERHPLQVMAILHGHYQRMLRIDGAAASAAEAATLLGIKDFQARKAFEQGQRLGREGQGRAFALLAEADLDLRGDREWPGPLVLEVLVARLSRLGPSPRRAGRPG